MIIPSVLDTDLYKLTMQQAVLEHFPTACVSYKFTNRNKTPFSQKATESIIASVNELSKIELTDEELAWLKSQCPYFKKPYLDYLKAYRFRPQEHVKAEVDASGKLELTISGLWHETILYEVPVMAIVSEVYFKTDDTQWDYQGQYDLAVEKGRQLFSAGCLVSEFGTRRRRSLLVQDIVLKGLMEASSAGLKGKLTGTSNAYFAYKFKLVPIGTIAHEWIMGIAALEGYEGANGRAMDLWEKTYPSGALSIALTDTFSSKVFFEAFEADCARARRWKGLRQDSGDPFEFINTAKCAFEAVGCKPSEKLIVFSDGLDLTTALKLKQACDEKNVGCSFGIGTFLTNDFRKVDTPDVSNITGKGPIRAGEPSKALNMVIKLYSINGEDCVKISDNLSKNSGNPETVRLVKARFGLEQTAAA